MNDFKSTVKGQVDAYRAAKRETDQRLLDTYRAIWADAMSAVRRWEVEVPGTGTLTPSADLPFWDRFIELRTLDLKAGGAAQWARTRPFERAIAAFEAHDSAQQDSIRRLPESAFIGGAEFVEILGIEGWRAQLTRRRTRVKCLLRGAVQLQALAAGERHAELHGTYFLTLDEAWLHLLALGQTQCRSVLESLANGETGNVIPDARDAAWVARWNEIAVKVTKTLGDLKARQSVDGLSFAVFWGSADSGRLDELMNRRRERFGFWARQHRAVQGLVELERSMTALASDLGHATQDSLQGLDAESAELREEFEAVEIWLRERQAGTATRDFPAPAAKLLPAESRVAAWRQTVQAAARKRLPVEMETGNARRSLPSRVIRWRRFEPLFACLQQVEESGLPPVMAAFEEVEGEHRAVVRTLERVGEVVAFSASDSGSGDEVAREALANSLALLQHRQEVMKPPRAISERRFVQAISAALAATLFRLERSRLGVMARFARQSGRHAAQGALAFVRERATAGGRGGISLLQRGLEWSLIRTGWEAPRDLAEAPVVGRAYLGDVLRLEFLGRELPAIYRRLFRLAPVEDPRFLIGREAEMAALAEARSLWQAGRSVSVLLIGARGSGKTSLLNCALNGELRGIDTVRGHFSERVTDRASMRSFIACLMGAPDESNLQSTLTSRRTVVILEELERTFLRRINGFEGLQELMRIISASSRTILWIVVTNEDSFHYLDAAHGLRQHFSHRINAMAISEANLKSAILLRHKLSGLRLHYPPVPTSDARVNAVREMLGIRRKAEDQYFEALYRQSQGVFRSAFELWQHFVERTEGGVLYLKPPVEPNIEPLLSEVTQEDAFALKAILQHGSLTVREHAMVFECPEENSVLRLQRLSDLEFLEADPSGPGLRIRPEAGRIVRTALHRLNLL